MKRFLKFTRNGNSLAKSSSEISCDLRHRLGTFIVYISIVSKTMDVYHNKGECSNKVVVETYTEMDSKA